MYAQSVKAVMADAERLVVIATNLRNCVPFLYVELLPNTFDYIKHIYNPCTNICETDNPIIGIPELLDDEIEPLFCDNAVEQLEELLKEYL